MKWQMILIALGLAVALATAQEPKKDTEPKKDPLDEFFKQFKEPELAKELAKRHHSDQKIRNEFIAFSAKHQLAGKENLNKLDGEIGKEFQALVDKLKAEDQRNTEWLKQAIKKHGWPGKSLVGEMGAQNAWLLVQHADADRPFQKECLAKMEALPKGEVQPKHLAYLTDRILVGEGKKQKYGTQAGMKDGKVVPGAIDDEAQVDERRKAIGLEPLAEYLKQLEKVYNPEPKK